MAAFAVRMPAPSDPGIPAAIRQASETDGRRGGDIEDAITETTAVNDRRTRVRAHTGTDDLHAVGDVEVAPTRRGRQRIGSGGHIDNIGSAPGSAFAG